MSKRLDCELGRSIGQRYDDEGARADWEIGKGDALAVASGHELGFEIATVFILFEILFWRRQGRSRRLRRGARARVVEDDGIHHFAWWHGCAAAAAGTGEPQRPPGGNPGAGRRPGPGKQKNHRFF